MVHPNLSRLAPASMMGDGQKEEQRTERRTKQETGRRVACRAGGRGRRDFAEERAGPARRVDRARRQTDVGRGGARGDDETKASASQRQGRLSGGRRQEPARREPMAELGETLLGGLARGVDGDDATAATTVSVCHPGSSKTSLITTSGNLATRIAFGLMSLSPMVQSAEKGSWPEAMCATEEGLEPRALYGPTGRSPTRMTRPSSSGSGCAPSRRPASRGSCEGAHVHLSHRRARRGGVRRRSRCLSRLVHISHRSAAAPEDLFAVVERRARAGMVLGVGLVFIAVPALRPWAVSLPSAIFYWMTGVLAARLLGLVLDGAAPRQWLLVAVEVGVMTLAALWLWRFSGPVDASPR